MSEFTAEFIFTMTPVSATSLFSYPQSTGLWPVLALTHNLFHVPVLQKSHIRETLTHSACADSSTDSKWFKTVENCENA